MKGATAVSSATVLVPRLPIQLNLVLVRIQGHCSISVVSNIFYNYMMLYCLCCACSWSSQSHYSKKIFLKDGVIDKFVMFTAEATGAEPSLAKPILRFVPTAGILQSNQIAERAITTYWHPVRTADFHYSQGFVKRGILANFQKVFEKQSELGSW